MGPGDRQYIGKNLRFRQQSDRGKNIAKYTFFCLVNQIDIPPHICTAHAINSILLSNYSIRAMQCMHHAWCTHRVYANYFHVLLIFHELFANFSILCDDCHTFWYEKYVELPQKHTENKQKITTIVANKLFFISFYICRHQSNLQEAFRKQ